MARREEDVKEEYLKNLDPKEFQEFKLRGLREDKPDNNYDFYFKCLFDFFSNGELLLFNLKDICERFEKYFIVLNTFTFNIFLRHNYVIL